MGEAAEAEAEAEAEKEETARIRREKKANMTKEDKKAKVMCGQYKKKAAAAQEDGTLVDEAKYKKALQLMDDDEWVQAEIALKEAMGSNLEEEKQKSATEEENTEPGIENTHPSAPKPTPVAAGLPEDILAVVAVMNSAFAELPDQTFKRAVGCLKIAAAADNLGKAGDQTKALEAALAYMKG